MHYKVTTGTSWPADAVTQKFGFIGRSGCHAPGQGILLADGNIKAVETIEVGDHLMGSDGTVRSVLQLCHGTDEMFRIEPTKGKSFVVNGEHQLTVVRLREMISAKTHVDGSKGPRTLNSSSGRVSEVTVREWLGWPAGRRARYKLFRVGADFPCGTPLPIDPYFLGVLLGDGHMKMRVSVTTVDEEILCEVKSQAKLHGLTVTRSVGTQRTPSYTLAGRAGAGRSNPIINKLRALGLYGHLSGDKFIPHIYKVSQRHERAALLAGLIDTDGSLARNCVDYITKSAVLAEDVAFIARSLGLAANIRPCQKYDQHGRGGTYHRIGISGDLMRVPCRVARKKPSPRRQVKDVLHTGFAVQSVGQGEYYGFVLDGDGRYLLDDFTVTHNSGKTFGSGRFVEQLLDAGAQVVIVDPVGTWYGLRLDADGKSPGISIPVLGGVRGDKNIPLEATAGTLIADVVVDKGVSLVLDVSGFTKSELRRFTLDFATHLLDRKKRSPSAMMVVWDECQDVVPQKVFRENARMVGAMEDLIKKGRNFGLGTCLISQRPQAVNKDVLSQVECLVCFQLTGRHERKAIQDWVVDKDIEDDVLLDTLPSLDIGTAYVWSPQWLKTFEQVKFLKKRTFDASATPQFGKSALKTRELAPIDLEQLREAMKATIERAKETDPSLLREELRKAQSEIRRLQAREPEKERIVEREKVVEKPVLGKVAERHLKEVSAFSRELQKVLPDMLGALIKFNEVTEAACRVRAASPRPAPVVAMPARTTPIKPAGPLRPQRTKSSDDSGNGEFRLVRGHREILKALACRHPTPLTRVQIAVLAGCSHKSGSFNTYMAALKVRGLVEKNGDLFNITQAGLDTLGADIPPRPKSRDELIELWCSRLVGKAKDMLRALEGNRQGLTRDELANCVEMSANSGSFNTYLARINSCGLLVKDGGLNHLNPEVFEA